jgi:hypothetical protein
MKKTPPKKLSVPCISEVDPSGEIDAILSLGDKALDVFNRLGNQAAESFTNAASGYLKLKDDIEVVKVHLGILTAQRDARNLAVEALDSALASLRKMNAMSLVQLLADAAQPAKLNVSRGKLEDLVGHMSQHTVSSFRIGDKTVFFLWTQR